MSYPNTQQTQIGRSKSARGRRGQTLIMVTFSITFLMGVLGLAVDVGWMHYVKQSEQAATDSGAMAAVYAAKWQYNNPAGSPSHKYCSNSGTCLASATGFTSCSSLATAGYSAYSACQYAESNGFPASAVQVAEGVNSAPLSGGATATYWAEVLITQQVPQLFSFVLGNKTGTVAAFTTATISASASACVTIMDPNASDFWGSGEGALFATGSGANLIAGCGIAVLSAGADAISANGTATVTGGGINDCGGENAPLGTQSTIASGSGLPNNSNAKPCNVTDPNASLPLPVVNGTTASAKANTGPPCGSFPNGEASTTTFDSNTNYATGLNGGSSSTAHPIVLNAGVYCGGLTIQGAVVQFNPGVYIMNGGQFTIQNSSTATNLTTGGDGSGGVTFYLTAYNGQSYHGFLLGDSNIVKVDLTAPTSGNYAGVLIYQDPGLPAPSGPGQADQSTINAHGTFTLDGEIYLPTTPLVLSGQPTELGVTGLDVYALELNGSASLTMANGASGNSTAGTVAMTQ